MSEELCPFSPGRDTAGRTDISVVIPAYRSGRALPDLYSRLAPVLSQSGVPWEIIIVDDGSGDDTYESMRGLRKNDARVKIIRLAKNYGQHQATLCGLRCARGAYVVTMDDDLQHPPEEIMKVVEPLKQGYHVVVGSYAEKRHSPLRNAASWLAEQASWMLLGKPRNLTWSSFKGLSRYAVDAISRRRGSRAYLSSLILASVPLASIVNVDVAHDERRYGASGYSWGRLAVLFLSLVALQTAVGRRSLLLYGAALILLAGLGAISLFSGAPKGNEALVTALASLAALVGGGALLAWGRAGYAYARTIGKSCGAGDVIIAEQEG